MSKIDLKDLLKEVTATEKNKSAFSLFRKTLEHKGYTVSDTYVEGNKAKVDIINPDGVKLTQDINGMAETYGAIAWLHTYDVSEALAEFISLIENHFEFFKDNK